MISISSSQGSYRAYLGLGFRSLVFRRKEVDSGRVSKSSRTSHSHRKRWPWQDIYKEHHTHKLNKGVLPTPCLPVGGVTDCRISGYFVVLAAADIPCSTNESLHREELAVKEEMRPRLPRSDELQVSLGFRVTAGV